METKEMKLFTLRVKTQHKPFEITRKTLPTERETAEELTALRRITMDTPFRVYLDDNTTIVLAKREHNESNTLLFNGVDSNRLFTTELN